MKSVEASAATREDAIQKGLEELGLEMYEVDKIEIIDEGSKGFLGFGARPVKVRLVVEGMDDAPSSSRKERGGRDRGRRSGRDRKRDGQEQGERKDSRDTKGRDRKDRDNKNRDNKNREPKPREEDSEERTDNKNRRGSKRRNRRGSNRGNEGGENREQRAEQAPESKGNKGGSKQRQDRGRKRNERTEQPEEQVVEAAREEVVVAPEAVSVPDNSADEAATIVNITDEQGAEAAALLKEIIAKMGIDSEVEFIRGDDGGARLDVASEDGAILIGRKGRNLNAMQYLVNRLISQNDSAENTERLVVDVEGYVDRRRSTLEDMARSFARKVKDTGRSMRLKPLSPQERRIIHLTLQDDPDVRTYSLGESLFRSVVVSPANGEDERPRGDRGSRNRGGGRGDRGDRGGRPDRGERRERTDRSETPVRTAAAVALKEPKQEPKRKQGDPNARKRGFGRYSFDDDIDVGTFGD